MRRFGVLAGCLGIVVLLVGGRSWAPVVAQSATPVALSGATGVTAEPVAGGYVSALPPGGGIVDLLQYRFAPGAVATLGADAPPLLVLAVESGALTVESHGAATIQRARTGNSQPAPETVAAGSVVRLEPGDSLVGLSPAGSVLRNEQTTDATVLSVGIRPNAPGAASQPSAATPVASAGMALALAVVIPPACPAGSHLGSAAPEATPGGGGGGGGGGGVAMALAAAPGCVSGGAPTTP